MNKDAEHEGQHEKWQYVATMVEEEEKKVTTWKLQL